MDITLTTASGGRSKSALQVSDATFGLEFNEALVHQVVTACMAGARAGTHAQKTRSQVRGGGSKPWRQKGTGRARAGSIRSPLWRGGGKIFAAQPRDYSQKVNRKMYRAAYRSILSELLRQERLVVVGELKVKEARTKALWEKLKALVGAESALIVTESIDDKLWLSARNLPNVGVTDVVSLDPVSLVRFEKVVMTSGAVKAIEERLG